MDLGKIEWRKSSYSGSENECVEVAMAPQASSPFTSTGKPRLILMRDSKDPDGPHLRFTPDEWRIFRASITGNALDIGSLEVH